MTHTSIVGCLLGTAVGDAMGLPYEGLSRGRAAKLFGPPDRYRLLFGRGMVSDDTEHTCMVAQSLIASGGQLETFQRDLARRLRLWLIGLPAGIGLATLRSILRLWIGFSPARSGVFSAGNGPAMRSAILGAAIDDPTQLREVVRVSTRITHTDPKAEYGASAVALAAQMACRNESVPPAEYLDRLTSLLGTDGDELVQLIRDGVKSVEKDQTSLEFADSLALTKGVSGYVYHSVPVAVHAWLRHQTDFRAAVTAVVECGGDTDSTGAIVGGIVGAAVGKAGIPAPWLQRLCEWPRTVRWMEQLGEQLSTSLQSGQSARPLGLSALTVFPRNLFFLIVVLFHGFRRLFPPY
jgi:ADP-ribosyl-[dinitrogen reductase] hydrolase